MRATVRLARIVILALVPAACATTGIDDGVFRSDKGYRVTIPSDRWTATARKGADLDLRERDGQAGIVVNASCEAPVPRGPLPMLARHLLVGFKDRTVLTAEDVSIDGRVARHAIVEGHLDGADEAFTVEVYVMRDARCVYDFLYAAPSASFDAGRRDFERVVQTFTTNR